jgi:hypothetical protein
MAGVRPVSDQMSGEEFAVKVQWEGGVIDALEYGLRYEDIDPAEEDLRKMWAEAEGKYRDLALTVRDIEKVFEERGWDE